MLDFDRNDATYFNQFPNEYISKINVLRKISRLPKDLCEVFCSKEISIMHRISGIFDGYTIDFVREHSEILKIKNTIKVIFTSGEIEHSLKLPQALYISNSCNIRTGNYECSFDELSQCKIRSYIKDTVKNLTLEQAKCISELEEMYAGDVSNESIYSDYEFNRSLSTEANLIVLESAKLDFSYESSRYECPDEDLTETINVINCIKNKISRNIPPKVSIKHNDIIISDMSINLDFQVNKQDYSQNALKHEGESEPRQLEKTIKMLLRNDINEKTERSKYVDMAYSERLLIEVILGLHSCAHLTPNVKIPLSNVDLYATLKDIGINDRNDNQSSLKKKFKVLIDTLQNKVSDKLEYLSENYSSAIKVVSNLPIEWVPHNGLPLMVRHDVSRVPVSPGWLTSKILLDTNKIHIDLESFSQVLIISSFGDDDQIKDHLSSKIKIFNENDFSGSMHNFKLKIDIKKPSDGEELISILNQTNCPLVVFDCHGAHSKDSCGVIALKDETISIFDIVKKARFPPIVVLSSCDASPIDRNHYSTANAFLAGGAKTVLATALPILSHESSTFIMRLMIRLQKFLPIVIKNESRSILWSTFMSGMIRRTFYTELIEHLIKIRLVDKSKKTALNSIYGMNLDPLKDNFHSIILSSIADELGITPIEIQEIIDTDMVLPECLKYLQFGSPEQVIINSPEHIPILN